MIILFFYFFSYPKINLKKNQKKEFSYINKLKKKHLKIRITYHVFISALTK